MSRLERLFTLLTADSPVARAQAAEQLGGVARAHPESVFALVDRLRDLLSSARHEERLAAAEAIRHVVAVVPAWDPSAAEGASGTVAEPERVRLTFEELNIDDVIGRGVPLLSSGGKEFYVDWSTIDVKKQVEVARRLLAKRIGASLGRRGFEELDQLVTPADLKQSVAAAAKAAAAAASATLTRREQAMLDMQKAADARRQKVALSAQSADRGSSASPDGLWPFLRLCDVWLDDIFSPEWTVRHGACLGLAAVLRLHGSGAGRRAGAAPADNLRAHEVWVVDCASRLLCVLVLDRFMDLFGDRTLFPVREVCAQALGSVLRLTTAAAVGEVFSRLARACAHANLDVRLAGFLGLKYVVAVRGDLVGSLAGPLLPILVGGLRCDSEDVRGVAAESLTLVAGSLSDPHEGALRAAWVRHRGDVESASWAALARGDDLDATSGCVLRLLSDVYALGNGLGPEQAGDALPRHVSTLAGFFERPVEDTRLAAAQTVERLVPATVPGAFGPAPLARLLFQVVLREEQSEAVLRAATSAFVAVAPLCPPDLLAVCLRLVALRPGAVPAAGDWMPASEAADQLGPAQRGTKRSREGTTVGSARRTAPRRPDEGGGGGGGGGEDEDEDDHVHRGSVAATVRGSRALGAWLRAGTDELRAAASRAALPAVLSSARASDRQAGALVVEDWLDGGARRPAGEEGACGELLVSALRSSVPAEPAEKAALVDSFEETAPLRRQLAGRVGALLDAMGFAPDHDWRARSAGPGGAGPVDSELVLRLAGPLFDEWAKRYADTSPEQVAAASALRCLPSSTLQQLDLAGQGLWLAVSSAAARAVVVASPLPERFSHLVNVLVTSVKSETDETLQARSALGLARLVAAWPAAGSKGRGKLVDRLIDGFALDLDSAAAAAASRRAEEGTAAASAKSGARRAHPSSSSASDRETASALAAAMDDETSGLAARGCRAAVQEVARVVGDDLLSWLPSLQERLVRAPADGTAAQFVELQVLEALGPAASLRTAEWLLENLWAGLVMALTSGNAVVVSQAAATAAELCRRLPDAVLAAALRDVAPWLADGSKASDAARAGAAGLLHALLTARSLERAVIPYLGFVVEPLMGCMSDREPAVRREAAAAFAAAVRLLPLEAGVPDPPGMAEPLRAERLARRPFLLQLQDGHRVEPFRLTVPIRATLREYQRDGVSWLAFLHRHRLHGILCDDMGLGKTLQVICVLASAHQEALERAAQQGASPAPSLVVCPPSLISHWDNEIQRFVGGAGLRTVMVRGDLSERRAALARELAAPHQGLGLVVIASYDTVRLDLAQFGRVRFNYCVLDEGHLIKNSSSKLSQAMRTLVAEHRVILSGTPVQNNVLELWTLFDFLMPGYLGTEAHFRRTYSLVIEKSMKSQAALSAARCAVPASVGARLRAQAGEATQADREAQEKGAEALEALHRQVLPFVMRRMKEDVLKELPAKDVQDLVCDLSALQSEVLQRRHAQLQQLREAAESAGDGRSRPPSAQALEALLFMRKVCSHPVLVTGRAQDRGVEHAPKLLRLKQLLLECGIGWGAAGAGPAATDPSSEDAAGGGIGGGTVGAAHRVLVFAQLNETLDLVESELFGRELAGVEFLRIDGSVPDHQRQGLVDKFNSDPSVDVMLLTTHVGGLGLNLTGADTVVMLEHDWNPFVDQQAMDRAHRIGQTRKVTVYRLLMRGTVEEHILNVQRFKEDVSRQVVNIDNAALSNIGDSAVLTRLERAAAVDAPAAGQGEGMDVDEEAAEASMSLQDFRREYGRGMGSGGAADDDDNTQ